MISNGLNAPAPTRSSKPEPQPLERGAETSQTADVSQAARQGATAASNVAASAKAGAASGFESVGGAGTSQATIQSPNVANAAHVTTAALGWCDGPAVEGPRFSKHNGPDVTFPLDEAGQASLEGSNAVSPILSDDPRVLVPPTFLNAPTTPGDPGFWDEFETVLDLQVRRNEGASADTELELPKIFEGKDMAEAAEAVHADFPTDFPTALAKQFLAEGAKIDTDILPALTQAEFVNSVVALSEIIGWGVSTVSPSAFASKWEYGRPRPEEVAWAIHTGELDAPAHIKEKVAALDLQSMEDFTAYPEGAPRHPAYPAMHSAASVASLYLAVVFDLSPEQVAEARNLDFAVATSRTLAGVHYESDNIAGLSLGQEVVAQNLAQFLADKFGADPAKVQAKIEEFRYDWSTHPRPTSAVGELPDVVRDTEYFVAA